MPSTESDEANPSAEEINRLLDLAIHRRRRTDPQGGEYALFQEVLGASVQTDILFSRFLHDVTCCPKEVITAMQRLLAVGTATNA